MNPGATEAQIQRAIIDLVRAVLPKALVFHVPNGGSRGPIEAKILQGQGVVPGVADLILFPGGGRTFCIECKSATGKQSAAQRDFEAACGWLGIPYGVARGVDEALGLLRGWGLVTEGRSSGR